MKFHHYLLSSFIISALCMNAETSVAATCPTTQLDLATLQIDIPCVLYQGTQYTGVMHTVSGIPGANLVWQLDAVSLKPSACATGTASCAITSSALGVTFKQVDIGGTAYTAKLAYTQYPDDPSGLYWQYLSHQPESGTQAIDLRVSYYDTYENTLTKQAQIEANLRHLSEAIYEASNGVHRLGKITVFSDGGYADDTDILWLKDTNDSGQPCWFNSQLGGYGQKGQRILHCDVGANNPSRYDMLKAPRAGGYTLGHEWGLFFYGLYDEYKGQSFCNSNRPFAPCSTDKPADISIMNTQWNAINTADDSLADARWLNFSTVQSGSTENANYRMYGTTSWETLIRTPDQDPPHPGNKRTYRHELLAKAPASGQAPSVELDTPEGIAAAAQDLQVIFKPGASQPTAARQSQNQPVEWIGTVRQIVIDHSTAVSSEYLSKIKAAAQTIVDDTELGDVIGIIAVDSEVNILQTLTTIDSEATRDALITRIENINSGTGLPFTGQALNTALQGLFDFGSLEQRTHSVYLLTHGTQASDDISIRVAAGELTRNDVLLFILGESQEVAINQLLLDAAESTGGEFYRATSPRRLQEALEQVHQLASPTVDVTIAHAFDEFEQHSSMDFYLDENLGKVYVTIEFEGTLENLQLSLLDPQDTTQPITLQQCQDVIQENKVPGEAKVELYHFCTQELLQPQVGLWTLQLDYTQTEAEAQQPDAHVETIITISALPKNNADSFFAAMWIEEPEPLIVGDSVTVFATLNADMPITGLQVTGTIETEDEQSIPMTLRDDGIAPDRIAQDGVYMGSFTPEAAGKYLVYADFNNTNNTAWYSNLGLFYAPDQDGNVPEQLLTPVNYLFQRFALKQVWVIE